MLKLNEKFVSFAAAGTTMFALAGQAAAAEKTYIIEGTQNGTGTPFTLTLVTDGVDDNASLDISEENVVSFSSPTCDIPAGQVSGAGGGGTVKIELDDQNTTDTADDISSFSVVGLAGTNGCIVQEINIEKNGPTTLAFNAAGEQTGPFSETGTYDVNSIDIRQFPNPNFQGVATDVIVQSGQEQEAINVPISGAMITLGGVALAGIGIRARRIQDRNGAFAATFE